MTPTREAIQELCKQTWSDPRLNVESRELAAERNVMLDDEWVARFAKLAPSEVLQIANDWDGFFANRTRVIAKGFLDFGGDAAANTGRLEFYRGLDCNNFGREDMQIEGGMLKIDVDREVAKDSPDDHASFRAVARVAKHGAIEVTRDGVVMRFAAPNARDRALVEAVVAKARKPAPKKSAKPAKKAKSAKKFVAKAKTKPAKKAPTKKSTKKRR